jgi:hypothetical protein
MLSAMKDFSTRMIGTILVVFIWIVMMILIPPLQKYVFTTLLFFGLVVAVIWFTYSTAFMKVWKQKEEDDPDHPMDGVY